MKCFDRFVVLNMEYSNTYMLDLDVSVHFEANETAAMTVKVLDDILVPRIQCQQNAGYVNKCKIYFVLFLICLFM
jgi:hypothetical protein